MAKRLGVFCFFDKDEIIQRCDEYLLEELKKNVEQLIVVINGNINKNSLDVIHRLELLKAVPFPGELAVLGMEG